MQITGSSASPWNQGGWKEVRSPLAFEASILNSLNPGDPRIAEPVGVGGEVSRVPGTPPPLASGQAGKQQATGVPSDPLREAFREFVGQTFFSELIKSYRSTQKPAAYFHGGRAEQIFQGQLDQILAEQLSHRTADTIADPMFELFMAKRL